jgi:V/A-type H+-transporting ATPase subunit C
MEDLGFINARIRALKEKLLKRSDFEEFISSNDFYSFLESLSKTDYGRDLPPNIRDISLEDGISSLNSNFSRYINKIIGFSSGEPKLLLETVIAKFLVSNIRAIVRGKMRGMSREEIESAIFPIGELDYPKIKVLLEKEEASQVLELLLSMRITLPFSITSSLIRKVRENDIGFFENYIDKSYYEWAMKTVETGNGNKEVVRHLVKSWCDLKNIIGAALYLKYEIIPSSKLDPLPYGYLSYAQRKRIFNSQNLKEFSEVILSTPYREFAELLSSPESITIFEKRFEESLTGWAIKGFLRDPLSIAIPIAFIMSKYNELINLRIIMLGKYHGVDPKEIRKEVFFV